jgi:hypothetical protein
MQRCAILNGSCGLSRSEDKEIGVNDDFKKLGYRLRPRVVEPAQPGRIAFDDRGNAVYEWNDDRLAEEGEAGERARRKALDHPGLSMVEEEHPGNAPIRNNAKGLRLGYNPYESGLLPRKPAAKKRDLRELSKWLEMKKRVEDKGD